VTMDGDGQNDPNDIPALVAQLRSTRGDSRNGQRRQRKERVAQRRVAASATRVARRLAGVTVDDTGCGLKAFQAARLKDIELLRDDHRFLPALAAGPDGFVAEAWVGDRPRISGRSHYGYERIPQVAVDLFG